jgi:hypothetical protein
MDLKEIGWEAVDWITLAWDKVLNFFFMSFVIGIPNRTQSVGNWTCFHSRVT